MCHFLTSSITFILTNIIICKCRLPGALLSCNEGEKSVPCESTIRQTRSSGLEEGKALAVGTTA